MAKREIINKISEYLDPALSAETVLLRLRAATGSYTIGDVRIAAGERVRVEKSLADAADPALVEVAE